MSYDDDTMTREDMWDALESLGVEEQTLMIVTTINGYAKETMLDILHAHTGLRAFHQIED
nr:MAG TPA: Aac(3)-IIIb protein [Caudoviricetes sp.]